jgi:carbonic anhydrase/acetyltransferase-like protein (isoleucine patch superfamily)
MSIAEDASILSHPVGTPVIAPSAFIAAGARIIGAVTIDEGASVWFNAVLRADSAAIVIGPRSNVQDNVSVHVDQGHGVVVGSDVSVGHNAVVHGCTIGDGSLIGMGSVVLSGAVIGAGCLIAAGAVVLEGSVFPDGSLVAGVPAKVRRSLTDDEKAGIAGNAAAYLTHAAAHRLSEPVERPEASHNEEAPE